MGNNKEKNNKSSFKIILAPIYFIWYIVFGVYVVFYSIFKFVFDIFKYIFIGLKTILYFVFYPIISLKNNQKNNKKQNVADRHFDGKIIDSQDKVDHILEKKNKQILKIEQKKLKKEKALKIVPFLLSFQKRKSRFPFSISTRFFRTIS